MTSTPEFVSTPSNEILNQINTTELPHSLANTLVKFLLVCLNVKHFSIDQDFNEKLVLMLYLIFQFLCDLKQDQENQNQSKGQFFINYFNKILLSKKVLF